MKELVFQVWKSCFHLPMAILYTFYPRTFLMSPLHSLSLKMWILIYYMPYFWHFASSYYALWCWWRPSWKKAPYVNRTHVRKCHHAVSWPPTPQWLILDMVFGCRYPPLFGASAAALIAMATKFEKKSAITRLVYDISRKSLRPAGGSRGRAIQWCQTNFNRTDRGCHGNEIWDKIVYDSACIQDISEIFASNMGQLMDAPCVVPSRVTQKIFAVLVEWCHRIVLTMSFIYKE